MCLSNSKHEKEQKTEEKKRKRFKKKKKESGGSTRWVQTLNDEGGQRQSVRQRQRREKKMKPKLGGLEGINTPHMTQPAYKRKTHLSFLSNFTMAQYYEHYRKSRYARPFIVLRCCCLPC